MQEHSPFSKLAKLIRQRQVEVGDTPCFATAASYECANKQCCWHHECFDESVDIRLREDCTL